MGNRSFMLFCFVHGFQFLMVRNYCSVALPSVASSFKQAARGRSDAPKISLDKFLLLIPLFFLYCFTVILQSVPWGIRRLLRLRVPWCRPCVRQACRQSSLWPILLMMLSGGPVHMHISPMTAAGSLPINTVGAPGPMTGPPAWGMGGKPGVCIGQVCMSVILAAGGIILSA